MKVSAVVCDSGCGCGCGGVGRVEDLDKRGRNEGFSCRNREDYLMRKDEGSVSECECECE